jgi:glycosyltransferase involved in cell wall biosynthesis
VILRRAVRCAARIVCPSQATRTDLVEFLADDEELAQQVYRKTRVIRNGVSTDWAESSVDVRRHVRSELELEGPYILCVGNGKPHKNLKLALYLADRLASDGYPHRLIMVGPTGSHMEHLLAGRNARTVGARVRVVGPVTDRQLAALYAESAVALTPSLYEGFGLPPLEAMMAGTPVIASNRGGLPESVGKVAGALVDPLDTDAWYVELKRLICNDEYRLRRIEAGRRHAEQMSWSATTAKLAAELAEIAERPNVVRSAARQTA